MPVKSTIKFRIWHMNTFTLLNPYFYEKPVNCTEISMKTKINKWTIQRYYKKFLAQIVHSEIEKQGRQLSFLKSLNRKKRTIAKKTIFEYYNIQNIIKKSSTLNRLAPTVVEHGKDVTNENCFTLLNKLLYLNCFQSSFIITY